MSDNGGDGALVTGASSGIGLVTAVRLAEAGFRVFASMRDVSRRGALLERAERAGVTVEVVELDVTQPETIASAVAEIDDRAGRVDLLVNNAGVGLGGMLEDVSMDEFREVFETNFFGVVAVTKAVLPAMRERRRGRIINISSGAGRVGQPGMSVYCSSKWAVEGLSESLRLELARDGIYVVIVEPGSFKTEIFGRNLRIAEGALAEGSRNREVSEKARDLVLGRAGVLGGDPDRVARAIVRVARARHPRVRYAVGADVRAMIAARQVLPERVVRAGVGWALRRLGRD